MDDEIFADKNVQANFLPMKASNQPYDIEALKSQSDCADVQAQREQMEQNKLR